eukprot:12427730-Karenia_brevis.AAC.1
MKRKEDKEMREWVKAEEERKRKETEEEKRAQEAKKRRLEEEHDDFEDIAFGRNESMFERDISIIEL